jgi:hypothetical protein
MLGLMAEAAKGKGTTVIIPRVLHRRIRAWARENRYGVSSAVQLAIEAWLKQGVPLTAAAGKKE